MSTGELCSILEASAKAGVAELKFGDLHVRFGRSVEQVVGIDPQTGQAMLYPFTQQSPTPASVAVMTEAQHIEQTKEALVQDEVRLREDQLRHLMITDPLAYEKLLAEGELTDDVDGADEDAD